MKSIVALVHREKFLLRLLLLINPYYDCWLETSALGFYYDRHKIVADVEELS